jgi:hypothetical protein
MASVAGRPCLLSAASRDGSGQSECHNSLATNYSRSGVFSARRRTIARTVFFAECAAPANSRVVRDSWFCLFDLRAFLSPQFRNFRYDVLAPQDTRRYEDCSPNIAFWRQFALKTTRPSLLRTQDNLFQHDASDTILQFVEFLPCRNFMPNMLQNSIPRGPGR